MELNEILKSRKVDADGNLILETPPEALIDFLCYLYENVERNTTEGEGKINSLNAIADLLFIVNALAPMCTPTTEEEQPKPKSKQIRKTPKNYS